MKMILSCDCADQHSHDVKRMKYAVRSLVKGRFGIRCVVADKGCDAEYVHVEIRERLGAEAFISVRIVTEPATAGRSKVRTSSFNRGRMKFLFDKGIYNLRF